MAKSKRPYDGTKVSIPKSRMDVDELAVGLLRALRISLALGALRPRVDGEAHVEAVALVSRRLHRVLYFAVKSRLEVVESGLETPFAVWLPQLETGDGRTVVEQLAEHRADLATPKASVAGLLALPTASRVTAISEGA